MNIAGRPLSARQRARFQHEAEAMELALQGDSVEAELRLSWAYPDLGQIVLVQIGVLAAIILPGLVGLGLGYAPSVLIFAFYGTLYAFPLCMFAMIWLFLTHANLFAARQALSGIRLGQPAAAQRRLAQARQKLNIS